MKKLTIDNGLLLTDMEVTFKGKNLQLNRVLIDTGSASTIISSDLAETIGIQADGNDPVYRICGVGGSEIVYSKVVDSIKIGHMKADKIQIEIGAMDYDFHIEGIIGLNLLKQLKAMINIENLSLQSG